MLRLGPPMSGDVRSVLLFAALVAGAACSSGGPGREPVTSPMAVDGGGEAQPMPSSGPEAGATSDAGPEVATVPPADAMAAADATPAADAGDDTQSVVVPERPARTARGCPAIRAAAGRCWNPPTGRGDRRLLPAAVPERPAAGERQAGPGRAAQPPGGAASVRSGGEVPGGGGRGRQRLQPVTRWCSSVFRASPRWGRARGCIRRGRSASST